MSSCAVQCCAVPSSPPRERQSWACKTQVSKTQVSKTQVSKCLGTVCLDAVCLGTVWVTSSLCFFWGVLSWCLATCLLHILLHIPNEPVYHEKMWLKDCSTGDLLGENAVLGLTADGNNTIDASALVLSYLEIGPLMSFPHVFPSCLSLMSYPQCQSLGPTCLRQHPRKAHGAHTCKAASSYDTLLRHAVASSYVTWKTVDYNL